MGATGKREWFRYLPFARVLCGSGPISQFQSATPVLISMGATGKDEVLCPCFVMPSLPGKEVLDGHGSKGTGKIKSVPNHFARGTRRKG